MKLNVFSRRLTVYTKNKVIFSAHRGALAGKFPNALVAPMLSNFEEYVSPQAITKAKDIRDDAPWYLRVGNKYEVRFTLAGIDVICETLCNEEREVRIVNEMASFLKEVLNILGVNEVTVVAYAPSIGVDEEENFKVSEYLPSKVNVPKKGKELHSVTLAYKVKVNLFGEERQLNYICKIGRGVKTNNETKEKSDCLIIEVDLNIKEGGPFGIDFADGFYAHAYEWNEGTLNTILQ